MTWRITWKRRFAKDIKLRSVVKRGSIAVKDTVSVTVRSRAARRDLVPMMCVASSSISCAKCRNCVKKFTKVAPLKRSAVGTPSSVRRMAVAPSRKRDPINPPVRMPAPARRGSALPSRVLSGATMMAVMVTMPVSTVIVLRGLLDRPRQTGPARMHLRPKVRACCLN